MITALHWLNDVSANFSTAADWTSNTPPGPTNDAIIDAAGTKAYTVTSNAGVTVNSLSLAATATLLLSSSSSFTALFGTTGSVTPEANAGVISIGNGSTFAIGGNFDNANKITLNSSGTATNFKIAGPVALSGGGLLTLSNNASNFIVSNGSPQTFTNVDNTISGAGTIGDANLTLVNDQSGVIKATVSHALVLNTVSNTIVNLGALEDTGAGGLQIESSVNNATTSDPIGGIIEAIGASAHVDLSNADIIGGTLITESGGRIDTIATQFGSELDGLSGIGSSLTNAGKFVVVNDSGLTIQGVIYNVGSITLAASGASPQKTELILSANATLDGGGTLTMSNNATNSIVTNGTVATLTNEETISGAGTIGFVNQLTLDNEGLINATGSNALVLSTGTNAIVNDGLMETTGRGGLVVASAVTNGGGALAALGTGGLVLSNTVTNGALTAQNTGSHIDLKGGTIADAGISILAGATLDTVTGHSGTVDDSKVSNAGTISVANNSTLTASGVVDNTGKFVLNGSTEATALSLDGDLTLDGGGLVTLSNNANNTVSAATNATLTNGNNTISGAGRIGNADLTLDNEAAGIINANGTIALTLDTGVNVIDNEGLLRSTGKGGLVIASALDNMGVVTGAGSTKLIISETLDNSGLVQSTGTGGLELNGDNNTNTIDNSGAIDATGTGALLILGATIDNSGGTIGALAAHSSIALQSSTIDGGTLVTLAGASLAVATGTANTIDSAELDNAGSIVLANGSTLVLDDDTVNNHGTIALDASSLATDLEIADTTTLQGAGQVTLTNSTFNSIVSNGSSATLDNVNDTIYGAGTIGDPNLTFENTGTVVANGTNALTLAAGALDNEGTIKTTGTGGIVFMTGADNSGGTILANGKGALTVSDTSVITGGVVAAQVSGAKINLSNGSLDGAAVFTVAGSTINALAGTTDTIDDSGVSNLGTIAVADNATLDVGGTINNVGSILLNSSNDPTNLDVSGNGLFLTGGGKVTLTNNSNNSIGAAITTIATLTAAIGGSATDGDVITLTFTNAGLSLSEPVVYDVIGTPSLVTIAAGLAQAVNNDTTLSADGITASASGGIVTVSEPGAVSNNTAVAESVSGAASETVALSNGGDLAGGADSMLTNVNNTISGAGTIGAANLTLVNNGTINANDSHALILNTGLNAIENNGKISETGTGGLTIESDVDNQGVVSASGTGTLLVEDDADISGGIISTLAKGSNIQLDDGQLGDALIPTVANSTISTAANSTIATVAGTMGNAIMGDVANAGSIVVTDNSELTLFGAVDNTGTISLNAASHTTEVEVGILTLTGQGKVTLSNNADNEIFSASGISPATASVIVGGTVTAGDTVSLTFTNPEFSLPETVSYVVPNGASPTSIATALVTAINADLVAENITADNSLGRSPTITVSEPGAVGNETVVSGNVSGSLAVTIGSTPQAGDMITLTFANNAFGNLPESVSYTVTGTDTATSIATALTSDINVDTTLGADGITATSSSGVVTVHESGSVGTATTVTDTVAGSLTATIGGTAVVGDIVSLTFANSSFGTETVSYVVQNGNAANIASGLTTVIGGDAVLIGAGITAASNGNEITVSDSGITGDQTVVSESITGTVTATIGGTGTASDQLKLTFTNASLSLSEQVSITATAGETPTALATALAGAIIGDTALGNDGITATSSVGVITITEANLSGNPTIVSESVTSGATETIALSDSGNLPGETVALSNGGDITNDTAMIPAPGTLIGETLNFGNGGDLSDGGSLLANVDNTISGAGTIGDGTMTLTNSVNGIVNANGIDPLTINAGLLLNSGLIESTSSGGLTIDPGSVFINNGTLAATVGLIDVESTVTGTGTANISGIGQIEFAAPDTNQNVAFTSGASGELFLANSQSFTGNISGFAGGSIDLEDIPFVTGVGATTDVWASSSNVGGTLTVAQSGSTTTLDLLGTYTQASFNISSDGKGGTLITDPPVDQANHTIANGATVKIATAAMGTDTFAGKSGTLVLDLATEFAGKISGFGGKDSIDLADIGFGSNSTLGYNATGSNTGTLTVSDGTHTANIALLGSYMASSFATASDGHGGTLITEAVTAAQNQLTQPHA